MEDCYLTSLLRKFMRGMAGFNPAIASNYYIVRAKISPPATLEALVWPELDPWQARFQKGDMDDMDIVGISYVAKHTLTVIGCAGVSKAAGTASDNSIAGLYSATSTQSPASALATS